MTQQHLEENAKIRNIVIGKNKIAILGKNIIIITTHNL